MKKEVDNQIMVAKLWKLNIKKKIWQVQPTCNFSWPWLNAYSFLWLSLKFCMISHRSCLCKCIHQWYHLVDYWELAQEHTWGPSRNETKYKMTHHFRNFVSILSFIDMHNILRCTFQGLSLLLNPPIRHLLVFMDTSLLRSWPGCHGTGIVIIIGCHGNCMLSW